MRAWRVALRSDSERVEAIFGARGIGQPRTKPDMSGMNRCLANRVLAASVLLAAGTLGHVHSQAQSQAQTYAQYDRDGRYVPSPMGVPADPYARPIPNYSGKPGDNKGTPIWPRGTPSAPLPSMLPRSETPPHRLPGRLPVALPAEVCAEGWSRALGLTRVEFNRGCLKYRKR